MNDEFDRFGGLCAVIAGVLSVLYAFFYLVLAGRTEFIGIFGSWVILAASGLFTSAAYVALYQRIKGNGENAFALWALLLGEMASFATLMHGGYQALVVNQLRTADPAARALIEQLGTVPSQADPAGLATFGVVGLAVGLFGWQILRTRTLSRSLGYLGLFNALLLIGLYAATATDSQTLILISGGLTALLVGPLWWVWAGVQLMRHSRPASNPASLRTAPA